MGVKYKRGTPRPVPADFAETVVRLDYLIDKLRKHYAVGYPTLRRWLDEAAIPRKVPKGYRNSGEFALPPADFAENAARMTLAELNRHYGSKKRVKRWRAISGVQPKPAQVAQPVPADFAQVAPTMIRTELEHHYGVSHSKIARWIAESGVRPLRICDIPIERQTKYKPRFGRAAGSPYRVLNDQRVGVRSMYDDAADTLRRERFIVYRCDERGRADAKGEYWRSGNTLLTPDELLMRAKRYEKRAA